MERVIPDFMKKYHEVVDEEGKEFINRIAARYEEEKQMFFQTTFVEKQGFQNDWNRLTGSRTHITQDEAIEPLNRRYEEEVKQVAGKYGYVDPDEQEQDSENESRAEETTSAEQELIEVQPQDNQQNGEQSKQETTREQFLQNLQSMREKAATQTHRPKH